MLVLLHPAVLLLVVDQVEARDVVLDFDLAREVHELSGRGGTLVSREGIGYNRSSLEPSSRACREAKELRVVTRFWSWAGCGSLIMRDNNIIAFHYIYWRFQPTPTIPRSPYRDISMRHTLGL
jgi:hypothetical protein